MNHCTDSDGSFLKEMKARDIGKYLVDYRSHQKKRGVEMNDDMYPFYQQLKPPYTDAPSPKVRAGDVIEVTLKENIPIFGFRMKGSLSVL